LQAVRPLRDPRQRFAVGQYADLLYIDRMPRLVQNWSCPVAPCTVSCGGTSPILFLPAQNTEDTCSFWVVERSHLLEMIYKMIIQIRNQMIIQMVIQMINQMINQIIIQMINQIINQIFIQIINQMINQMIN
jgi:hypothetical protein